MSVIQLYNDYVDKKMSVKDRADIFSIVMDFEGFSATYNGYFSSDLRKVITLASIIFLHVVHKNCSPLFHRANLNVWFELDVKRIQKELDLSIEDMSELRRILTRLNCPPKGTDISSVFFLACHVKYTDIDDLLSEAYTHFNRGQVSKELIEDIVINSRKAYFNKLIHFSRYPEVLGPLTIRDVVKIPDDIVKLTAPVVKSRLASYLHIG